MEPRDWLRERAHALGFDAIGFARPPAPGEPFPEGERFAEWLRRGHAAGMGYLARTAARRISPHAVAPGLRGVAVLVKRYPGAAAEPAPGEGRVARYARGRDYHNVLGRRARRLAAAFRRAWSGEQAWAFVDRGDLLEKAWAVRAGLGWLGKNGLVLHPEQGSYILLAALLVTVDLGQDATQPDLCGACRLCLDSCPTGAFPEPYVVDARRCISYWTIEHRGSIPAELRPRIGDWLLGCDVCQEVCPWNLRPLGLLDPAFGAADTPLHEPLADLLALDREGFAARTRGRPLARPGRDGLLRNAAVVAGNGGDPAHVPLLVPLLADPSPVVRGHAAWALGAIGGGAARRALTAALALASDEPTRREIAAALARA